MVATSATLGNPLQEGVPAMQRLGEARRDRGYAESDQRSRINLSQRLSPPAIMMDLADTRLRPMSESQPGQIDSDLA
jgi:hypothetical protein